MKSSIEKFLSYLPGTAAPGLLISSDAHDHGDIRELLLAEGYREATDWRTVLSSFKENNPTFVCLGTELPKELYDLLAQYTGRRGMIQVIDPDSLELECVQFAGAKPPLIFVCRCSDYEEIENEWAISDKIGLMEWV